MEISEEQFKKYESIRVSGITNMFAVNTVVELSGGILSREQCLYIMDNYEKLRGEVKK